MFHQLSKVTKKKCKDEGSLEDDLNLGCNNSPPSFEEGIRMGFEIEDYGKLGGIESTSTLFEKVVPVRVTKANAEDRHMDITARFIMGLSKVHRSTKVLQIQLTNELDPFFFYSLEVSEDDFQSLKVEQCILVDFATFPYKFIELLEQCIVSSCTDNLRGTGRFLAVLHLRTGDSTLTVVETNHFKHLSHLSLVFRQGNDAVIKQFLAGRLAEYKAINGDMHEKLRRTLHSLEKALRDVNNLSSELGELKENQCRNISELKAEFTLELAHEKEKVMQETTELKERLEKERVELESRLRQQIDQQQQRASDLDKQVRSLLDAKYKTDNKITELKNKCNSLEKDLEEKTQEGDRLRREKRSLETDKIEGDRETNRHLTRLSALEQEVSDKNELLSKMTMQLEGQASQRSALEISRNEAQAAADRAEERASASALELSKCYQVMEKLQVELRASKQKVKLKGQVTSQQDNLLNERQSAMEKAQAENASLRSELATVKSDMEEKKKKSEELTTKLDEAQNVLQSNQQMIQWLNQQLTEAQLGKLPAPPSSRFTASSFTRPTSTYSCLTSTATTPTTTRPGEATTPLSSNSANSGSIAGFKSQFPMSSSPYFSSPGTPIAGIKGGAVLNHSLRGDQRPMYVPVTTKIAVQAAQTFQFKSKVDGGKFAWEPDSGSWGAKLNLLPRPQLLSADRSGYSTMTTSAVTIDRPNSNVCQSNCSRPPSPNQQQSPPAPTEGVGVQSSASGDQVPSPNRAQQASKLGHVECRENPSPARAARAAAMKSPPRNHFSRR